MAGICKKFRTSGGKKFRVPGANTSSGSEFSVQWGAAPPVDTVLMPEIPSSTSIPELRKNGQDIPQPRNGVYQPARRADLRRPQKSITTIPDSYTAADIASSMQSIHA